MKKQIQKKGEQKGKQLGIQEGRKESKREIAKQMLIKGMDMKTIEEITGLSRQWIGRLRNEIKEATSS